MGAIAVVAIVVVGAGAYLAASGGKSTTTVTSTLSASTVTSLSNSNLPAASLNAGGGTLVYPLMQDWINTYSFLQPNIQVSYSAVGSGTGIHDITTGLVTIGESDAPLTAAQYAALPAGSKLLTIPISDSGIIPAYNIPGITAHLNFTGNVLAEIFYGTITQWNDPRLQAINPGVTLPAHAIAVFHRSDGSGTMYGFTQFLSDSNSTWKANVGFSTGTLAWPVGVGCLHNAGVAQCIASTSYSIGPLEIAYEIANPGQINYGAVQNAAGNYILANLTNISEALAAGVKGGLPTTDAQWSSYSVIQATFNDTTDKYIYPVSTFTYGLIYQDLSASYASTSQPQAVAALNFLHFIVNEGQACSDPTTCPNDAGVTLGYPGLPPSAVNLDNQVLATITYNGSPVLS